MVMDMTHEDIARRNHCGGFNCAQSVYAAYADLLGISTAQAMREAPKPRSEGGRCGAFLAGRALLERLKPDAVADFEAAFERLNGTAECRRLVAAHGALRKSCNDYVGDAARLVAERLGGDRE